PDVSSARRQQLLAARKGQVDAEGTILRQLWAALRRVSPLREATKASETRVRDALLRMYGIDTDRATHPLLIRTAAAFLDQGVSYWTMPGREEGYLKAFRELYKLDAPPLDRALTGLSRELKRHATLEWDAAHTVHWALE